MTTTATDHDRLYRLAARAILIAVPLGLVSNVLFLLAAGGDIGTLTTEPEALVTAGASKANLLRWAAVTDMFGYYLLHAPFILAVRARLREYAPNAMDAYAVAGVLYVVVGAAGAAMFAAVAPGTIESYASSPRVATAADFGLIIDAVWRGMWQTVNPIFAATFWLGVASVVGVRHRLGTLSALVGTFAIVLAFGRIIGVDALVITGLAGFLTLALLVPLVFTVTRVNPSPATD